MFWKRGSVCSVSPCHTLPGWRRREARGQTLLIEECPRLPRSHRCDRQAEWCIRLHVGSVSVEGVQGGDPIPQATKLRSSFRVGGPCWGPLPSFPLRWNFRGWRFLGPSQMVVGVGAGLGQGAWAMQGPGLGPDRFMKPHQQLGTGQGLSRPARPNSCPLLHGGGLSQTGKTLTQNASLLGGVGVQNSTPSPRVAP